MPIVKVKLNGTNVNPYERWGLTQNPFPQAGGASYESLHGCLQMQALGGKPIPNVQYIRDTLQDCSQEFIDLCCSQYRVGEIVEFSVEWPE